MKRKRYSSGRNMQTIQPIENKLQTAQEHGERPTLTASANIASDNLQSEKQRRDDSGKWYPVESSERCKRKSCKYHSIHPSAPYSCEYSLIAEEPKTHRPEYRRLSPPENGCSLYEPMPPHWRALRMHELIQRENQQARAINVLRQQFPYLYDIDKEE